MLNMIREREWRFIGHVLREEQSIEKHIMMTELDGRGQEEGIERR